MANGAFGFVALADTDGAFHAEEVVSAGNKCSCDLALEADHTLPASRNGGPSGVDLGKALKSFPLAPPWQARKAGFRRPLRGVGLDCTATPGTLLLCENIWRGAVVLLTAPHGTSGFGHAVIHLLLVVGEQVSVVEFVLIVEPRRLVNRLGRAVADAAEAVLPEGREGLAPARRAVHPPAFRVSVFHARVRAAGEKVVLVVVLEDFPSAYRDVRLDLLPGALHVSRGPRDLEDGVPVAAWRDDVGVGLLLDPFNGSALGSDHQTHHSVRDSHSDSHLTG